MTTALVLAGHGSHISPNTAGVVWALVDALRAQGAADEVTAAFWKEQPAFHNVIDTLCADDITVVPLFTADGYFTRTVIPAEMGLDGQITRRAGRTIRYAAPLGSHPALGQVVQRRVMAALAAHDLDAGDTAVAIIGHGTRRSASSRDATEAQARLLREITVVAEVAAVYLDDTPAIPDAYTLTTAPNLIAVPYFLASGSHTTIDVPSALGLDAGQMTGIVRGRHVIYTPPIGQEESLADWVLDLARAAGARLESRQPEGVWPGFPAAGRSELVDAVARAGTLVFGELALSLRRVCINGDTNPSERLETPAELRRRVRETPFRPLATARGLPGGWHVEIESPDMLHAVVETVYPGAIAAWAAQRTNASVTTTLSQVAARQAGAFRALGALDRTAQADLVDRVCGDCVCAPVWSGISLEGPALICAEPCNLWMSRARGEAAS